MRTLILCLLAAAGISCAAPVRILDPTTTLKPRVEAFNRLDDELYAPGAFPNARAWEFLRDRIPYFDCPDSQLVQTYYFRWWTYRKHIRATPEGYIVTEFLPDVPWAGPYNAIACPAAHHFYEGRWLRDPSFLTDYARFWFEGSGRQAVRSYSFWAANALLHFARIHPVDSLLIRLRPALEANYAAWKREKCDSTGLFWQSDNRDGMEVSISGTYGGRKPCGYRPTINSYMYGEARALAAICTLAGDTARAHAYDREAACLRTRINRRLWDAGDSFYKVIPLEYGGRFSDARELLGYTPWYFGIAEPAHSVAWRFLISPDHFRAPFGPTTADRSHPGFRIAREGHECQWNGPSWPYATSVTLTALANLLHDDPAQAYITRADYLSLLLTYSRSHVISLDDGTRRPWIDENLDPFTGEWLARERLKSWKNGTWDPAKGGEERGKDYNHSTFADLIVTGLIGFRPAADGTFTIDPLLPPRTWDYFCLEHIPFRGHLVTVYYNKTGRRYGKGRGFFVLLDGKRIHRAARYGLTPPLAVR